MSIMSVIETDANDLLSVRPDAPLLKAVNKIVSRRANAAAVFDQENNLVGIITDHDVMRALGANSGHIDKMQVREWMTDKVITCSSETKLGTALSLMVRYHIRHLVVVADHRPIGVVGVREVLKKIHENDSLEINVLRDVALFRGVGTTA